MSLESDGALLMGTYGGFLRFHADDMDRQLTANAPVLVSVKVMFDEMLPLFRSQSNSLTLPYNRNFLTFHFSTFNYTLSASDRYQYQLEGYDHEWVSATSPQVAYLTLPPGKYSFFASVEHFDHRKVATSRLISFEIKPHFSQTIWFRALLLCLFLAAVYGIYRYRIQQFLRIQSSRNKIAGDLHDDVASTVSSISFYSDFAKKLPNWATTAESGRTFWKKSVTMRGKRSITCATLYGPSERKTTNIASCANGCRPLANRFAPRKESPLNGWKMV